MIFIRNLNEERTTRKVNRIIEEIHQIRVFNSHIV